MVLGGLARSTERMGHKCARLTWCHFLSQAGVWVAPASLLWLRCFLAPDTESITESGGGAASVPVVPASFLRGRGSSLMITPGDACLGHYTLAGDCPGGEVAAQKTSHLLLTIAPVCTPSQSSRRCVPRPPPKWEGSSRASCCPTPTLSLVTAPSGWQWGSDPVVQSCYLYDGALRRTCGVTGEPTPLE